MNIHCPKCHASRANLEPLVETLEAGVQLQTVRCTLCGHRVSRRLLAPALPRRPQPAAATAKTIPQPRKSRLYESNWTDCAVAGCRGQYVPGRSRNGWPLCKLHRRWMQGWVRTRQLSPPPLVEIQPGWWDVNPARTRAEQATQGGAPC